MTSPRPEITNVFRFMGPRLRGEYGEGCHNPVSSAKAEAQGPNNAPQHPEYIGLTGPWIPAFAGKTELGKTGAKNTN